MDTLNGALRQSVTGPDDAAAKSFALHHESRVVLNASIEAAFAYLDDFAKLSAHMSKSSGMMLGSKMTIEPDGGGGRVVGSHLRMSGKIAGVELYLDEVVIERDPPVRKVWETVAAQLLVVGRYRLGFELDSRGAGTDLWVFIDYELPEKWPARWLGRLLGRWYARWCTERMARDAATHFGTAA